MSSSVARLLITSGPTTIARVIGTVVVNSVKRGTYRTITHVCVKGCERLAPSITNGNTAPTVIRVAFSLFVRASLDHALPYSVFPRIVKPMHQASVDAAARTHVVAIQDIGLSGKHGSTMTDAKPNDFFVISNANRRHSHYPAKSFSGEVNSVLGKLYNLYSHFVTHISEVIRLARGRHPRLPLIVAHGGCVERVYER